MNPDVITAMEEKLNNLRREFNLAQEHKRAARDSALTSKNAAEFWDGEVDRLRQTILDFEAAILMLQAQP